MISLPLQFALLLTLGGVCQWLGWRLRLPAILFLLCTGIVLGPVAGVLNPDKLLGDLLFPFVSMGVAIVLFEGSLTLRFAEIKGVSNFIRNLTSIGAIVTWLGMAGLAYLLVDLSIEVALLFGALVAVTGPTVVVPMLRSIKTTPKVANVLRWEGIIVDPIGAILAVLVFEFILTGYQSQSALAFVKLLSIGVLLGAVGALALGYVLRHHLLPEYLRNYFALALVLLVFTLSNQFEHESGLVAVTVMGMTLANLRNINIEEILSFKEHLTVLTVSMLFILLAARTDFGLMAQLGFSALVLLLAAQFVIRPLSVWLSSFGTDLKWNELALISFVSPRGIVAAAISSLFALRLEEKGIPGAELLVPLTFTIIIGTVLLQSATAAKVAQRLELSQAEKEGVLIVGANSVSIAVAEALKNQNIDVLIADDHWVSINEARMKGLPTYFGSVLSEHADLYMDISGMDRMFLMSRRPEFNTLVYSRYRPNFGERKIFSLSLTVDSKEPSNDIRKTISQLDVRPLFGKDLSWTKMASIIAKGGVIKVTKLSETFTLDTFEQQWQGQAQKLFALSPQRKLMVCSGDTRLDIGPGWSLGYLVSPDQIAALEAAKQAESTSGITANTIVTPKEPNVCKSTPTN